MRFNTDLEVLRNVSARSFSLNGETITVQNSDLNLSYTSPANMFFVGSTAGQIITLGDALVGYTVGWEYRVHNGSTQDIAVRDFGLTVLGIVKPGATVIIYLEDNSTSPGVWFFGQINVPSAPAIVIPNWLCNVSANVNDLVVADSAIDQKVIVIGSNATIEMPQGVFGIILSKTSPTRCAVLFQGLVDGFSGLVDGTPLFVGLNGQVSASVPMTGMVQRVATAVSATRIMWNPSAPYRRAEG